MKPSTKFYTNQIARLGDLNFPPRSEEGYREAVNALAKSTDSEAHATRTVDRWLETQSDFPKPSELRQLAREIGADLERSAIPGPCTQCRGLEYVIVQRGEHSGAARCDCQRGQWLARKDREGRGDSWQPDRSGELSKVDVIADVLGLSPSVARAIHGVSQEPPDIPDIPGFVPITQADIDRAATERKNKAAGE